MENQLTIQSLFANHPHSKAFAFQVKGWAKNLLYLKMGEPIFTPKDNKYVSKVPVLVLNKDDKSLCYLELKIPRGTEIEDMEVWEFRSHFDHYSVEWWEKGLFKDKETERIYKSIVYGKE